MKSLTDDLLAEIRSTITIAKVKHPHAEWKGKGKYWALGELEEEYREVRQAVEHETDDRIRAELLDMIAVAIRMLAKEYE